MKIRKITLCWLLLAFALVVKVQADSPAVFTVNSTDDEPDATVGDGLCETADGVCTLRAALQESNAQEGLDTISLPAGNFEIVRQGVLENEGLFGDFDVTDGVIIQGESRETTIIDANSLDLVFDIWTSSEVVIRQVTIQNGLNPNGSGGAIINRGNLRLESCIVQDSQGQEAAHGLLNEFGGHLTINNCVFKDNRDGFEVRFGRENTHLHHTGFSLSIQNTVFDGSGQGVLLDGDALIESSQFINNTVGVHVARNAGLYGLTITGNSEEGLLNAGGKTVVYDSEITNNGRGIWNLRNGDLKVINADISRNHGYSPYDNSPVNGLAVFNQGIIEIGLSTITENKLDPPPDPMFPPINNGAIYTTEESLTIDRSLIANNELWWWGGAISYDCRVFEACSVTVTNSTISGNSARSGGAIHAHRGSTEEPTLTLINTTIYDNVATGDNGVAGIFNDDVAVTMANSVLVNNGSNCESTNGITSGGYNLISAESACQFNGATTTDMIGVQPILGELDTTYSPATHPPLPSSPLIDAANPDGCRDQNGNLMNSDQRGFMRTYDGDGDGSARCDIGAHEVGMLPPLTESLYLPLVNAEGNLIPISGFATPTAEPTTTQSSMVTGYLGLGLLMSLAAFALPFASFSVIQWREK